MNGNGGAGGQLNFHPGRMQTQAPEIALVLQKFQGSFGSIPAVTRHKVTGLPGMSAYLVLSSGKQPAFRQGVMLAVPQNLNMCDARHTRTFPPWVFPPSRSFGKRPFPGDWSAGRFHLFEPAMQNGKITLIHLAGLELGGKMPVYGPVPGHQDNTAGVAIEAVDRVEATVRAKPGFFPQATRGLEKRRQARTKIFTGVIVDTHARRFVSRQPADSSRQDGNCYCGGGLLFHIISGIVSTPPPNAMRTKRA